MITDSNIARLLVAAALFFAALIPASAQNGYAASAYTAQQAAYAQQQWAAYQQQVAVYNQQMAAYRAKQAAAAGPVVARPAAAPRAAAGALIRYDGRFASCSASLPVQVQYAINAANTLQNSPYVRGAGHGRVEDRAYDCSSSTSYALIKAGLLKAPLTSIGFANYGQAGEGRFITIWVKPGEHVFMTVCGLRLDTSGGKVGEGPRWRMKGRSYAGFSPRHPFGM
jgi:hypothetical protein